MSAERKSRVTRFSHRSPEVRGRYAQFFAEAFDHPSLHPAEREKFPQEVELLDAITARMGPFVESHGGIFVPTTSAHFKILKDEEKMSPQERQSLKYGAKGHVFGLQQHVTLFDSNLNKGNPLELAYVAVHEGLHLQSALQAVINDRERAVVNTVSGLSIYNPRLPDHHTGALNEAQTEDLTIQFLEQYAYELPYLWQFVIARDNVRAAAFSHIGQEAYDIAYIMVTRDSAGNMIFANEYKNYAYSPEREMLANLRGDISTQSHGRFTDAQVSSTFTQAYFSGEMGNLSRMVNDALGAGKFKKSFTWTFHTQEEARQNA